MEDSDNLGIAHLEVRYNSEDWQAGAACAEIGGDGWFPEERESTVAVKKICAECPVRQLCLDYAIKNRERYGVWGGMGSKERARLIKIQASAS
jgi:WhiB family transcriptional regulator, redox-sensing transcriptional regulator